MLSYPCTRKQIILSLAFLSSTCGAFITAPRNGRLKPYCSSKKCVIKTQPTARLLVRTTKTQLFDQNQKKSLQPLQEKNEEKLDNVSPPPQEVLKESLLSLAAETKRGFIATPNQRSKISGIIEKLCKYNPTAEPVKAYYNRVPQKMGSDIPTLSGKWTLVYTNAPDITGLDTTMATTSASGLALPKVPSILPQNAKLGRIGQECIPEESLIKNVIEWERPDWVQGILNKVGMTNEDDVDKSRVLQKVCCEATASPIKPTIVELKLSGFELQGDADIAKSSNSNEILSSFQDYALRGPAQYFERNPVNLSGPLKAPFGQFECLYLDQDMRIIKTGQGYFAVNVRLGGAEEWF